MKAQSVSATTEAPWPALVRLAASLTRRLTASRPMSCARRGGLSGRPMEREVAMLLEDKVAIVYGGGGLIGGAVARAFAREGARVFLAGRTPAKLDAVAGEISAAGGMVETARVDALDERSVEEHVGFGGSPQAKPRRGIATAVRRNSTSCSRARDGCASTASYSRWRSSTPCWSSRPRCASSSTTRTPTSSGSWLGHPRARKYARDDGRGAPLPLPGRSEGVAAGTPLTIRPHGTTDLCRGFCMDGGERQRPPMESTVSSIGAPGFEPGTSPTRTARATRLRHAPKRVEFSYRVPATVARGVRSAEP